MQWKSFRLGSSPQMAKEAGPFAWTPLPEKMAEKFL